MLRHALIITVGRGPGALPCLGIRKQQAGTGACLHSSLGRRLYPQILIPVILKILVQTIDPQLNLTYPLNHTTI